MVSVGRNLCSATDELMKMTVEQLYHSLRSPKPEIEAKIRQLRVVRDLDSALYARQKRALPYFVCGIFNPPFRRTENFAYTEYFIIDIDHISEKEMSLEGLRLNLQSDSRVVLSFVSPSQDGLKLMFRLKDRCYDSGLYSLFYKAFAQKFSAQYNLQQVIDASTCDVSRACFISIDKDAYYNPNAEPIELSAYVQLDNPSELFAQKHKLEIEIDKQKQRDIEPEPKEPDSEAVAKIKAILNPNATKRAQARNAYVPAELEDVMSGLKQYIEQTGTQITEIRNIQYGKKIHAKIGLQQAEVNLFFGKRGFTVVQTPKCGTTEEMNALLCELVETYIYTYNCGKQAELQNCM